MLTRLRAAIPLLALALALSLAATPLVEAVPPYRRQHVEANERALRAGFDAVEALAAPAWEPPSAILHARPPSDAKVRAETP